MSGRGLFLHHHDIEYVRIKQRKYRRVKLQLTPKYKQLSLYVQYSTNSNEPLYGQFYDKNLMLSKRTKFYPKERKLTYIIPYFEDQLTRRINRNVKAEIIFSEYGWKKITEYIMKHV